jgi:hypothetical protein
MLSGLNPGPPAIACPYCPRHFRSRGGRTKHILARHQADESEHHEPNPSAPPSPIPYSSPHPPSPVPSELSSSHYMPPPADYAPSPLPEYYMPPPSCGGADAAPPNSDDEDDIGYALLRGGMSNPQVPDTLPISRAYHPKLDGESVFFWVHTTDTNIACRTDLR